MHVLVTGDAAFKRFAVACDKAAGPDFDKRMDHGLKQAGEDIGQAVVTASPIYMPSGYEAVLASRLRAQSELMRRPSRGVTVTVYAGGRSGRRDVERLERGTLRHPVYGRYRRLKDGTLYKNPWSVTKIRPGFFSEPVRFSAPRAFKRLDVALGDVLQDIGKAS